MRIEKVTTPEAPRSYAFPEGGLPDRTGEPLGRAVFAEACRQVARIAALRLADLL